MDLERRALSDLRSFDVGGVSLEQALDSVLAYASLAELGAPVEALPGSIKVADLRSRYRKTLEDRPWKECACAICKALSVEVMIFRGSNRNKRRGIHNMGVFYFHVARIGENEPDYKALTYSAIQANQSPKHSVLTFAAKSIGRSPSPPSTASGETRRANLAASSGLRSRRISGR